MAAFLWNGYKGRVEMFLGTHEALMRLAEIHLEEGNDVIYFYVYIRSIEPEEN